MSNCPTDLECTLMNLRCSSMFLFIESMPMFSQLYLEPITPSKLCRSQSGNVDCDDLALQTGGLLLQEEPQPLRVVANGTV